MQKDFDIHYREWIDSYRGDEVENRELYGYILTTSGEFAIVSSAYYRLHTQAKIAELISLTAFSGMDADKVKKTIADGAENLYTHTRKVLGDPKEYKGVGAHAIEELIYRIPRDTRELTIYVAKNATDILTEYYEKVGAILEKKGLVDASRHHDKIGWDTYTKIETPKRIVSYTLSLNH